MRFQVPQFIEVEDKIFGQLTLKQFIYIAGGAGLSFALYRFLPSLIFSIIPIIIVMTFSLLLAFFKINNQPFINIVEAAFKYTTGSKLYIWKKDYNISSNQQNEEVKEARGYSSMIIPKVSDSKLKDLSWSLDINNKNKE